MKNWETLEADETRIVNKHYTPGRQGRTINKIVLHHNAGNLSIADCWNVWQTREASAHYQVDSTGRIGQLVWDTDTAWHSGDWNTNLTSIGIEHANISTSPYCISAETLDNGAHLVAALCRYYKLGRPQWGVNVYPHSHFCATACPASLQNEQRDEYMNRAQAWYDNPEMEDDMISNEQIQQIAHDVWAYKNQKVNGDRDAYNLLTHMPHDVNAYKNTNVSPRDVYGLITDLTENMSKLMTKVDELDKKVSA